MFDDGFDCSASAKLGLVPALDLIYFAREAGGGRIARQLGQVRKEAAVTRFIRVASPVSHPLLDLPRGELF